jgi:hypothetical protein
MTIITSAIARLLRTDEGMVRRAWSTARAVDSVETAPPKEFASGKGALALALAYFMLNQPVVFILGALGLVAFMGYEAWHAPLMFAASAAILSGVALITLRVFRNHG